MNTSLLTQEMRRTYAAQRGVSQGAHITLAASHSGYGARFECARRCVEVLGDRNLSDYGAGPVFHIPTEDLHSSIMKLAETFSVALVDTVTDEQGSRFVLVWKIVPRVQAAEAGNLIPVIPPEPLPAFAVQIQNSGPDELDEY